MMKKKSLYLLVSALLMAFTACATDAGYDPSDKYMGKKVEYVVYYGDYFTNSYYTSLPKCTDRWEGAIFYAFFDGNVYACIEGFWTFMRSIEQCSSEVLEAEVYYQFDSNTDFVSDQCRTSKQEDDYYDYYW